MYVLKRFSIFLYGLLQYFLLVLWIWPLVRKILIETQLLLFKNLSILFFCICLRAKVCWLLFCLCRPFCIFEISGFDFLLSQLGCRKFYTAHVIGGFLNVFQGHSRHSACVFSVEIAAFGPLKMASVTNFRIRSNF